MKQFILGSHPPPPAEGEALLRAASRTSRRNLWIRVVAQRRDGDALPRRISSVAIRAPDEVFPDPGGPCTKR
jgi:hypothetical protein